MNRVEKKGRGLSLFTDEASRRIGTVPITNAFFLFCSIALIFLFAAGAQSAETVGKFSAVEGKVDVLKDGRLPAIIAEHGVVVSANDIVRTKSGSKAEITFNDGNVVRIAEKSRISISEYIGGSRGVVSVSTGKVEAVVTKEMTKRIATSLGANKFEIRTPSAIAGVRGTDFFVSHIDNVTDVFVKEGVVAVQNLKFPDVIVNVTAGNVAVIEQHKPPEPAKPAAPQDMQKHEKDVMPEKRSDPPASSSSHLQSSHAKQRSELQKFTGCDK